MTPPATPSSRWQRLYAGAHARRRRFYRTRQRRLPLPVLSLGNLHWGGGGKTPTAQAVAKWLRDRGERVVILSRGYRRKGRGFLVVSEGGGPLCSPQRAGDEPFHLARTLPGVGVVVGKDRYTAGLLALSKLDPTLFLLDDGFSHLRLARDLDILLFPAADPFGGAKLAPGGRLREPLFSAACADAALLTGAPETEPARRLELAGQLESSLRPFGFSGPGFVGASRIEAVAADGSLLQPGARVVLVSGVARPAEVARSAEAVGLVVVDHLIFGDHHAYPERSLGRIRRSAQSETAELLVTGKDRIKLEDRLELPIGELRLEAHPEQRFLDWLGSELDLLSDRSASSA